MFRSTAPNPGKRFLTVAEPNLIVGASVSRMTDKSSSLGCPIVGWRSGIGLG